MAKNIKKFVNREFAKTVDLDLLKQLIAPYQSEIALDWSSLPEDERDKREAIFEFFRGTDERFPSALLDALHKIMVLSNESGAALLQEQAELAGVTIVPLNEAVSQPITPRHLALRAYLDRRAVFVMHELDGEPIPAVAAALGLPLNTAYSRLRTARELFTAALRRASARSASVRVVASYCAA